MTKVDEVDRCIAELERWKGNRVRKDLDVTALDTAIDLLHEYKEVLNMDLPREVYDVD